MTTLPRYELAHALKRMRDQIQRLTGEMTGLMRSTETMIRTTDIDALNKLQHFQFLNDCDLDTARITAYKTEIEQLKKIELKAMQSYSDYHH